MTPARSQGEKLVLASELPPGWDQLALRTPSPFLMRAWLDSWWGARGRGERVIASLVAEGELLAAASLAQSRIGTLTATADEHSGDWEVVAVDDRARSTLLGQLASLDHTVLSLGPMRSSALAHGAFARAGRRTRELEGPRSPYLELPGSFDELLAARSANLRSQLRRRRRALEGRGDLRLRTITGGATLEGDLEAVLRLEASGWKARAGTAMLSRPDTERLYRAFVHAAAKEGWLRLHLLELGGVPIAGDLACAIGGEGFLVKTGFDESLADFSPGFVLRGEVLRGCIEEGLRGYDFLGGPDPYKTRWTEELRPRTRVHGYRGMRSVPSEVWRHALRPALARARRHAQAVRRRR